MRFIATVLLSALLFIPTTAAQQQQPTELEAQYHGLLHQIMQLARERHVDGTESGTDVELWQGAIQGMLQRLDQHSGYLTPEEYGRDELAGKKKLSGIGAHVDPQANYVKIVAPISEDAPMAKAGLKGGDVIREVCNRDDDAAEWECVNIAAIGGDAAVQHHITGEEGSTVRLRIQRGSHLQWYEVVRETVHVPVIYSGTIGDDTVYLRMTQFTRGVADELRQAYNDRKAELPGQNVKYVVLDLRFNPGGVLPEAVAVSDGMFTGGRIVTAIGNDNEVQGAFNATPGLIFTDDVEILIMVNNFSASASEIVTCSAQDLRDGRSGQIMVAGEKTFGKGSIQEIMPMPDGGAIKLTTGRYFTATGRMIDGVGCTPDYVVSLEDGEALPHYYGKIEALDTQLDEALQVLRAE